MCKNIPVISMLLLPNNVLFLPIVVGLKMNYETVLLMSSLSYLQLLVRKWYAKLTFFDDRAVMSSQDAVSTVLKCMLKGAADYLIKPVRRNELRNLWQHVWRRQTVCSIFPLCPFSTLLDCLSLFNFCSDYYSLNYTYLLLSLYFLSTDWCTSSSKLNCSTA